jgi:hypothetical protein
MRYSNVKSDFAAGDIEIFMQWTVAERCSRILSLSRTRLQHGVPADSSRGPTAPDRTINAHGGGARVD